MARFGTGSVRTATRWRTRIGALAGAAAVAFAGLVAVQGAPAGAAVGTVTGATLEWTVNTEVQSAPPFGGCNYLSAGESDGTEGTYAASSTSVAVVKDGGPPTWANHCTLTNGAANQKVVLSGGTGTLDPGTGGSTIQFTGTFSVNFYGGYAPFWITNPKLVVDAAGNGAVTATLGGYAAEQANPGVKTPLSASPDVVVATLGGVSGANTSGFTVTPAYAGVAYDAPSGQTPQNRTTTGWGAWPAPFVDFQMQTGLGSYWYSSGGAADSKKPPAPITVGYGTYTPPNGSTPATTVDPASDVDPAVANTLAVAGTGFTVPSGAQGVYAGFVAASTWQPGQVPDAASFVGTQFVATGQITNGAFATSITVPAGTVADTTATWGVATFCAHACSATDRSLDTFTPVRFASEVTPPPPPPGDGALTVTATVTPEPGELSWTIDGRDRAVVLAAATNRGAYLQSTGSLKSITVTDTRAGTPEWSVSGRLGDFTGGLSGRYLGWAPKVVTQGAGATAGGAVASGIDGGAGLGRSSLLGSATAGHAAGSGTLGADLDLRVPATTPAGTYTATLTITALG